MSAASLRLLTLLLSVFCGWSLLVLLAVETGLGGRYSLQPEDAEQIAVPPSLRLDRAQSALGSLESYAVIAERPLFNADRRPLPPEATGTAAAPVAASAPLDVILTSVILRGDTQIAQFTDRTSGVSQTLKVGQSLAGEQSGWKLVELAARGAVFEGPSGRIDAELRVFDGQGGEAPTAPPAPPVITESTPPPAGGEGSAENPTAQVADEAQSPESRAEMIRRRIEERRRQMREEAARAAEKQKQ
ncbi:MAG: hypothetical protein ACT4NL_08315 [Pseudomarimonas sp.]